jgi:Fe-S cluster biosynthesis and repair protein YggX
MLLEYEESEQHDYVFIFDFHEDLVIMDTEASPDEVSFYQIKGKKSGTWTLNTLSKTQLDAEAKPLLSTLGKLYDCRERFKENTRKLTFLSNARYKIGLEDKTSSESRDLIYGKDFCQKDKKLLNTLLKEQLSLSEDLEIDDILQLQVLDISLTDSQRHLKGILSDFFKRRFNIAPDVDTVYKSFINEINKRSNYQKEIQSFEDLLKYKAIPKSAFTDWVSHIVHQELSLRKKWPELMNQLTSEKVHFVEIKRLRDGWTTFDLLSKDPNNQYLIKTTRLIQEVGLSMVDGKHLSMYEQLQIIYAAVKDKVPTAVNSEWVTKAIILNQLY